MAERINRIGTDKYTITVNPSGEIVLDTGLTGKVTINGNLDVLGDQTSIGSSELIVDDKTITINNGDPGGDAGITDLSDGYGKAAGIIIDRGPDANNARIFYDEDIKTIRNGAEPVNEGAFIFKLSTGDYAGIHTSSIVADTNQNLYLIGGGTGVVSVVGTTDYEKQIWDYTGSNITANPSTADKLDQPDDDDALVNARGLLDYVKGYFTYNFQDKITTGSITPTSVQVYDSETGGGTSRVEIKSDNSIIATFFETRVEFEDLRFDDNIITSNGINSDIVLKGSGTGVVSLDGWQNFTVQADPATTPSEGTTLYSKTLGDGGTGLFFINSDGTTDELVSRNKALLYSIIF
jgi:hypothetical protein